MCPHDVAIDLRYDFLCGPPEERLGIRVFKWLLDSSRDLPVDCSVHRCSLFAEAIL